MKKSISGALIFAIFLIFSAVCSANAENRESVTALEIPLNELKNEAESYFAPASGKIIAVSGKSVRTDSGLKKSVKPGMRFFTYNEGVNFVHPVTREPLGKMESAVGNIEITASDENGSEGIIIAGKPEDFLNARIKIPGKKVRVLFYQGNVDWYLGDMYYQVLKESGRFELVDTGIETDDMARLMAEAREKGAEALLMLGSSESSGRIQAVQKLFWVSDSKQFAEKKVSFDSSHIRALRFKAGLFASQEGAVLLSFNLPYRARHMSVGDIDGNGVQDVLLTSGDEIKIYNFGVELKLLWEFRAAPKSEILWADVLDVDKDGRHEILLTAMNNGEVTSYIYKFKDAGFVQLWKSKDIFIRKFEDGIIAQQYDKRNGYDGDVFNLLYSNGAWKNGEKLKLPSGTNIYDFEYIRSTTGERGILAWDDDGHLNLYNEGFVKTWRSKEDYGGFLVSFKREAPTVMVDRGEWSVKDRLVFNNGEILAPKRTPLVGVARGLGYRKSAVKSLMWNGLTVEERVLVDAIGGELFDYVFVDYRLLVLSKPVIGMNFANLLQGKSPLGVTLNIIPMKGR